jgi:hypothetical protein
MKRYVAKFLRAHNRDLLPETNPRDLARLDRIAFKWWQAYKTHCRTKPVATQGPTP